MKLPVDAKLAVYDIKCVNCAKCIVSHMHGRTLACWDRRPPDRFFIKNRDGDCRDFVMKVLG